MSDAPNRPPINPLEIVQALTADLLRQRLAHIEAERDSLQLLLRAAVRREQTLRRQQPPSKGGTARRPAKSAGGEG